MDDLPLFVGCMLTLALNWLLILCLCIPPILRGKQIFSLQLGNIYIELIFLPFATIFFFRPGWLKTATFCKKHPLTVAMAKERSPIKVPSENEDLPDKENAPDFDEDTLRGEQGSTLASATVKTFSIPPVSRM